MNTVGGVTEEHERITPSRVPRFATLINNGGGSTIWRLPLATTVNDIPLGEGVLLYGGLGSVTAITLFTIAHALLFNNTTTRRKRDLASLVKTSRDDPGLLSVLEGMYAQGGRWCGLRLTCELAAREQLDLGPDEKILLSFFRKVAAAQNLNVSTPQMHYGQAPQHALPAVRPALCRDLDGKCPYSARAMMEAYRTAHGKLEQRGPSQLKPSY